jgi:hypothetical protein
MFEFDLAERLLSYLEQESVTKEVLLERMNQMIAAELRQVFGGGLARAEDALHPSEV